MVTVYSFVIFPCKSHIKKYILCAHADISYQLLSPSLHNKVNCRKQTMMNTWHNTSVGCMHYKVHVVVLLQLMSPTVSRKPTFPSTDWVTSLVPSLLSYFLHHWASQWYEYQAVHIILKESPHPGSRASKQAPPRQSVACVWGYPICCSGSTWGYVSKCRHFAHATTIHNVCWVMDWGHAMYRSWLCVLVVTQRLNSCDSQTGSRDHRMACDITGLDHVTMCPFENQTPPKVWLLQTIIQWNLSYPTSMGPNHGWMSEMVRYVKCGSANYMMLTKRPEPAPTGLKRRDWFSIVKLPVKLHGFLTQHRPAYQHVLTTLLSKPKVDSFVKANQR